MLKFVPRSNREEYCLLVNTEKIHAAARRRSYSDVIIVKGETINALELLRIKSRCKAAVIIFYSTEGSQAQEKIHEQLRNAGINVIGWTFPEDQDLILKKPIQSEDDLCSSFPDKNEIEGLLITEGYIMDTDYTDRCGNCHSYMDKSDKYCKFCGTRRGEGKFLPFNNEMYCVYGPPIKKKYQCKKCNHKWYTAALGGGEDSLYCPQCGQEQVELTETKFLDFGDDPDADEE